MNRIRSFAALAGVTLAFTAATAAPPVSVVKQPDVKDPLPPGPHVVLTVPIELRDLPPEIDHFLVSCDVYDARFPGPKVRFMSDLPHPLGSGSATGAIAGAGGSAAAKIQANVTVEVFLSGSPPNPPTYADLERVKFYACSLGLQATAKGRATTYFHSSVWSDLPLSPGTSSGKPEATIPVSAAAALTLRDTGAIPP